MGAEDDMPKYLKQMHTNVPYRTPHAHVKADDRYNAFTYKAYNKHQYYGIGKPPRVTPVVKTQSRGISRFRTLYLAGHLPFELDCSAHEHKIVRLAWKTNIQDVNLETLFPILIEGLSDGMPKFGAMAELAIHNVMAHAERDSIYRALPTIVQPLHHVFNTRNNKIILCGLKALKRILTVFNHAGHLLEPVYRELVLPLNFYMERFEKMDKGVFYSQWVSKPLPEVILETLRFMEEMAGSKVKRQRAYRRIKRAIPTFESGVFPLSVRKAITYGHDRGEGDYLCQKTNTMRKEAIIKVHCHSDTKKRKPKSTFLSCQRIIDANIL